jgi:hypothetical protein
VEDNTPPTFKYTLSDFPPLPTARSKSPSPSISPQATAFVKSRSSEIQEGKGFSGTVDPAAATGNLIPQYNIVPHRHPMSKQNNHLLMLAVQNKQNLD